MVKPVHLHPTPKCSYHKEAPCHILQTNLKVNDTYQVEYIASSTKKISSKNHSLQLKYSTHCVKYKRIEQFLSSMKNMPTLFYMDNLQKGLFFVETVLYFSNENHRHRRLCPAVVHISRPVCQCMQLSHEEHQATDLCYMDLANPLATTC